MKSSASSRLLPWITFGALALAPLVLGDFRMSLLGQFLALAIVAIGIDLIWGYTGILSLGHAVYFGLGAYCTAMFLKLEAVKGALPDFMDWNGLTALPVWWKPFQNGAFAIAMSMILPAIVAALLGYFTFKNRIKGVFFSILSQALAIITVTFFIGQQAYTGGTNGITDFATAFGYPINDKRTQTFLFYLSLVVLMAAFFGCKKLVSGKFGHILLAIRDGENRLRFTGYNPTTYKVFIYAFSAALAGLAGALYAPQIGIVSPAQMGIVPSIGMVLWVAIGGRGTL
ncbi:MAG TPA: urea ABC transporter permease subunit UrtC, partial [Abditibacterium sp.]